jgi:hypothetical protein
MVIVKIGASARDFTSVNDIEESWINRQISGLRGDHHPVCVRVTVNEGPLNLMLTTPDCAGSGGGGGRPPNAKEAETFALWERVGLNKSEFSGGNLVAFFKQLRQFIR